MRHGQLDIGCRLTVGATRGRKALVAGLLSWLLIACGQGDEQSQQGRDRANMTVQATTQLPPTSTTTTLLAGLSDAALLTALEYPANRVTELAAKAPVRSAYSTNRSSTVVLSFQRNRPLNTENAAAVTQYFESIQNVRLIIDPLGTGPTVFEIDSDPNTRRHIVVLLGASGPGPKRDQ